MGFLAIALFIKILKSALLYQLSYEVSLFRPILDKDRTYYKTFFCFKSYFISYLLIWAPTI